jgi:cobalt-zinc-cadmium efflux system protein
MTHNHSHHHGAHDHHDHPSPVNTAAARQRKLLLAFVLTAAMMVVEAAGGIWSGSLALLADAGHMLVDSLAMLLALAGAWFATRPPDARRSFGYGRMEVLAGFVNALTQFALIAFIAYEAMQRLFAPTPILSGIMLAVAVLGLTVNVLVLRTLHDHDHDDVNIAGASLHVLGDLLGSVGAILAAVAVRWMGWLWADPVLSLLVSLLIMRSAWLLLRRSSHILLEGTPDGIRVDEIEAVLRDSDPGIRDIHHVHVWQVTSGSRMATLHADMHEGANQARALTAIKATLLSKYAIGHATVQIDPGHCPDSDEACADQAHTGR